MISVNFSRIDKNITKPTKAKDSLSVPQNNYAENYTTPLNSFNKYLVNFTGLNRTISKTAYKSAKSIKSELDNCPRSNGVVGNLPSEWINKIPKSSRESIIKELYDNFKIIINEFRVKANAKETAQNLSKALKKAGILNSNENVTMEKLGNGNFGKGYHLKGVSDGNLMIKVFDSNSFQSFGEDVNGNYPEINRAACWQKNAGKNTQMVRFHFGDINAGYMVNKYVNEETPIAKRYVAPEVYGLSSTDVAEVGQLNGKNMINGFQIDYGGLKVLCSDIFRNKEAQTSIKNIMAAPIEKKLELLKNTNNMVKKILVGSTTALSDEEYVVCFKRLAQNADNELKASLADKLSVLPKAEMASYFKQFAHKADNELKKVLAAKLYCLPDAEQVVYFKKFAKNADNNMKEVLAGKLYCLPETEMVVYFKQFANSADDKMKKILAAKVTFLPESERAVCRQLVA